MGPEKACRIFGAKYPDADEYEVTLYGSLSATGKGHLTDRIIIETFRPTKTRVIFGDCSEETLEHPNKMMLIARKNGEKLGESVVYSVGGGEIVFDGDEYERPKDVYPHANFAEIKEFCKENDLKLWQYAEIFEGDEIWDYAYGVWDAMKNCVARGLKADGILPGELGTRRKAKILYEQYVLNEDAETRENRLVCAYAFAASEENAGGGIVVTAPTCGSCGVLPAVFCYLQQKNEIPDKEIIKALLTAGIIGNVVKTNASISVSNDVIFTLFQKQVKSREKVTLGTNGGLGESANYIVFASASLPIVKGDVNADGIFNIADAVLLQKWILAVPNTVFADWKAGDLCEDNRLNSLDLSIMRKMLIETTSRMTPDEYMAQVASKVVEFEGNGAVDEKSDTQYGTFEKVTFTSAVCGGRSKSFNVLLPANYDKNKKYPVLYTLHGYWGDEDALLDKGDASLKLRQIIGNAIADGEAEEMIVVFPDIYASDSQDKCDGLNDKNNKAYDNFINELTKEIMPYMEQNYSVKTGRDNTAITGFSMGGRESLYIGFSRPDLFGYVGAMCPAPGLTTDLIKEDDLKFNGQSPYLLMVSAGSNDQIVWSTPSGYHDTMNKNGTTHIWHYVTDGDHGGKTIRPHMYNFVRNIFKA